MNRRKFLLYLNKIVYLFEILISIFLIIGILISVPDIISYYGAILRSDSLVGYDQFKQFLDHVLILVIAVEFVLLMTAHSDSTIIHLIMLVVARKMLIKSDNMMDILIGVISITILFAVRKFLMTSSVMDSIFTGSENNFSASTEIEEINKLENYQIDTKGYKTLGGLVSNLVKESGYELEMGTMVDDGEYIYEIVKISSNVIETISISKISG
ncbi:MULTISPECIES: transporter associated domain-containing protein [Peptoniphilus]|uniref:transporter associated domain-containing protein n=1 Tax=Peptoniphilus TaxID=162289 RepID=UPI0003B81E22|nr:MULTISPECIES: transporter associated domain-containing protein [Peptoniphilus]ERT62604.1 transporter associated domain protein [Peptoniphilus sp. BV3AC2]